MKKVLITGKNSYVGNSLTKWLEKKPDKYSIESVSLRDDSWKKKNFSKYDVVFHVVGIAHIKETRANSDLYYKINRDLAFEVAQKAQLEGVKQFVFLSSMSVYGIENGSINENSLLQPKSSYGKSKLEAENLIKPLENDSFKIAIIRPPMIYGKGCKGNYPRLSSIAVRFRIFPAFKNKRSMIFIDNFCEFVRLVIDDCTSGMFYPQNKQYVCTSEMVKLIAKVHGENMKLTKLFNPFIRLFKDRFDISNMNKVFGNLIYEKGLSEYKRDYCVTTFEESIVKTEGRE